MDIEARVALVNKPPIEEIVNFDIVNKPPIDELYHHGILGMRWGIRRYQNPDGSLTPEGQRRLDRQTTREENKRRKKEAKEQEKKERILRDPELLKKNIDKFTDEEVTRAIQNFEWQDKISNIKKQRSEKAWNNAMGIVDKAVTAGKVANLAVDFLNTPAGKTLRNKMGFGTEDIGKFPTPEEAAATRRAIEKANLDLRQQRANTAKSELDYAKANTQWEWDKADRHNKLFDEAMKRQNDAEDRANKRENDEISRERAKIQLERERTNWEDEKRNRANGSSTSSGSNSNVFNMNRSQINQDNLGRRKTETRSETPQIGLPGSTSRQTQQTTSQKLLGWDGLERANSTNSDIYTKEEWEEMMRRKRSGGRQYPAIRHNFIATNDFRAYSDYLQHYGVKGMKWGVRRYQDKNGRLTAEGKEHYGKGNNGSDREDGCILCVAAYAGILMAPYLAIAGIGAVGYGISSAVEKSKDNKRNKELYKDDNPNKITPDNLKKVNPKWGKPEYSKNCTKCACTTELVSRGITDYQAGKSNGGFTVKDYSKWFKGAKVKEITSTETALRDHFTKMKPGSSGIMGFAYEGGMGGHAIHWTVLNDGKVRFEDGQNGKSYELKDFMDEYKPASRIPSDVIRLDNCEPDMKKMREFEVVEPIDKKGGKR